MWMEIQHPKGFSRHLYLCAETVLAVHISVHMQLDGRRHTMTVLIDLRCSVLESALVLKPPPARPCDLDLVSNVLLAGAPRLAL